MAQEDLTVIHAKVANPSFDFSTRTLTLPIWKNVSSDLLDLMVGHEVGHALYTPPKGWELIHNKYGMQYNHAVQVVEDARIEKRMRRRFPGLRTSMYAGYTELIDRKYFSVSLEEMCHLPLLDRINVHFKLGIRSNVSFSSEEQTIVDQIEDLETWEDVERVVAILMIATKNDFVDMKRRPSKIKNKIDEWIKNTNNEEDIPALTICAADQIKADLIDKNARPIEYVTLPDICLKEYVIPFDVVYQILDEELTPKQRKLRSPLFNQFMKGNRSYIDSIAKEFELRKSANQFSRAYVERSGKLNLDVLWKHQLTDQIFFKKTVIPEGKNHGVFMILDMSISMSENLRGTVEQVLCMAMFCRRVNVPFDVYGFFNNETVEEEFLRCNIPFDFDPQLSQNKIDRRARRIPSEEAKVNALMITDERFRMKQLLSHTMSNSEFTNAAQNLLFVGAFRPEGSMRLRGTPLSAALVVANPLLKRFREITHCEKLTTLILSDGEGGMCLGVRTAHHTGRKNFVWENNYVIEDPETREKVFVVSPDKTEQIQVALMNMLSKTTDTRIVGLFLMPKKNYKKQIRDYSRWDRSFDHSRFENNYKKYFVQNKYFPLNHAGYDVFYMLPGSDLEIKHFRLQDIEAKTPDKILAAFKKVQQKKKISQVFVRSLIQQIA
jgi:hypothetical protein